MNNLPSHDQLTCGLHWEDETGTRRYYCDRCRLTMTERDWADDYPVPGVPAEPKREEKRKRAG